MTGRALIPDKVRRIVPSLGSPVDGEALGACRAIGRTLDNAGLDFHTLAASIDREPEADRTRTCPNATSTRSQPHRKPVLYDDWRDTWVHLHRRRHFTPKQELEHRRQIQFCQAHATRLSPRERAFVENIASLNNGLTFAQASWLGDIADRVHWESCAP